MDDEDLERELDELEQENFDKEIIGIPEPATTLPEVPGDELPEKAKEKKKATPAAAATTIADDGKFERKFSPRNLVRHTYYLLYLWLGKYSMINRITCII